MKLNMRKQKGFTVIELLITVVALASLALTGFGLYVLWHFISKFW